MNFSDLILHRQSCRRYAPRFVEHDKIEACLNAALLAPSACNAQPWKYIVVNEPQTVRQIADCAKKGVAGLNKFADEVPVWVVVVTEPVNLTSRLGGIIKGKKYALIDLGLSVGQFCLQAAELGLGTCIIGWFDERALRKTLRIPSGKRVNVIIALGYPTDNYPIRQKIRKDKSSTVSNNKYSY